MPNLIDATGLQTATRDELIAQYTGDYETIYGDDISLASNTPDGQSMNIDAQAVLDLEDLLLQIYNMFDPDNAIGVILDQRVAINGIQRQAGTFTQTNLTVVTNQDLSLWGLDQTSQPVFTYADNAGNQWQLITSVPSVTIGTNVFAFQAAVPGAVLTVPNSINVPVTIILGVVSVNNPTTYTVLGINEESDAALKIRRQLSVSLPSQGYLAGLYAALNNISGVTTSTVVENDTSDTDGNGVPSHSIWVIVDGTGAAASIANAIYTKRNAGCGMFGQTNFVITQVDGSPFVVRWDVVTTENLFIKFTATSLNGTNPPNIAQILAQLPNLFVPGVNAEVNINQLATIVQTIDPNCLVTNAGFSTTFNGTYTNTLSPTLKTQRFVLVSSDIIITPMILSPTVVTVAHTQSQQFTGLGGYGTLVYSMQAAPSGGSVNSATGLYTAGTTAGVSDAVLVTDSLGNTAVASVAVI